MTQRKVTLEDVARLAGVSAVTVSKVLNGQGRISERTRQRVRLAAERLGYVANAAARSLRGKPSRILGMVVPEMASPYFAELARAAADVAGRLGYDLGLFTTSRSPERERERVGSLLGGLVDGLILVGPSSSRQFLRALEQAPAPIVLINYFGPPTHLPVVRADNYQATTDLLHHLLALGHRRIAHISGAPHSGQGAERLRAYREVMQAAGLWNEHWVVSGGFTQEGGLWAARRLLAQDPPPTAIFAGNDLSALGVYEAARERGLKIPTQLSVVGFDDIPIADHLQPPLTTVAQPVQAMAKVAVELLVRGLSGQRLVEETREFPSQLVLRASTSAPM